MKHNGFLPVMAFWILLDPRGLHRLPWVDRTEVPQPTWPRPRLPCRWACPVEHEVGRGLLCNAATKPDMLTFRQTFFHNYANDIFQQILISLCFYRPKGKHVDHPKEKGQELWCDPQTFLNWKIFLVMGTPAWHKPAQDRRRIELLHGCQVKSCASCWNQTPPCLKLMDIIRIWDRQSKSMELLGLTTVAKNKGWLGENVPNVFSGRLAKAW